MSAEQVNYRQPEFKVIDCGNGKFTTEAGTPLQRLDPELGRMMAGSYRVDGKYYAMTDVMPASVKP